MIYLASPYSNPSRAVVEDRYQTTMAFCAEFMRRGHVLFSPILHCHELTKAHSLPSDAAYWQSYNYSILRRCESLWVLTLDGWETSVGVSDEISKASFLRMPIEYYDEKGAAILHLSSAHG